jgi:hypothetical protein
MASPEIYKQLTEIFGTCLMMTRSLLPLGPPRVT